MGSSTSSLNLQILQILLPLCLLATTVASHEWQFDPDPDVPSLVQLRHPCAPHHEVVHDVKMPNHKDTPTENNSASSYIWIGAKVFRVFFALLMYSSTTLLAGVTVAFINHRGIGLDDPIIRINWEALFRTIQVVLGHFLALLTGIYAWVRWGWNAVVDPERDYIPVVPNVIRRRAPNYVPVVPNVVRRRPEIRPQRPRPVALGVGAMMLRNNEYCVIERIDYSVDPPVYYVRMCHDGREIQTIRSRLRPIELCGDWTMDRHWQRLEEFRQKYPWAFAFGQQPQGLLQSGDRMMYTYRDGTLRPCVVMDPLNDSCFHPCEYYRIGIDGCVGAINAHISLLRRPAPGPVW